MKKILLFILASLSLASCDDDSNTVDVLDPVEMTPNTILIDGCEYIQYKSTLYCGHQYTHHEYQTYFLTHSGKCKNHETKD